jgi:hypothetical protein
MRFSRGAFRSKSAVCVVLLSRLVRLRGGDYSELFQPLERESAASAGSRRGPHRNRGPCVRCVILQEWMLRKCHAELAD